ncbi:GNAT family N-acetyltransferase [Ferrimonas marina]|uniref:Protein N-acetyltransferase, RimJ/RimL family n=1 Tax=Ferrimonas marina TaxID=299255 RepID=A0A1M5Z5V4_9GAMM|nr:GNAT family N-acetyltransferase [Ferrimonas marina]SHI19636.1 Protein N-acetyltransferase, RimJ/RimL family [Ferrimonas marina]
MNERAQRDSPVTTQRLSLTRWSSADAPAQPELFEQVVTVLQPEVVAELPPTFHGVTSPEQARQWLAQQSQQSDLYLVRQEGRLIGFVLLHRQGDGGHLGYLLAKSAWGQGLAFEMLQGLLPHYQGQLRWIEAGVAEDNLASIRLLQRLGFDRLSDGAMQRYRLNLAEDGR